MVRYDEKTVLLDRLKVIEDLKLQAEQTLIEAKNKGVQWLVDAAELEIKSIDKERNRILLSINHLDLGDSDLNSNLKISKFQIDSGLNLLIEDEITFALVWGNKIPSEVEYLEFVRDILNSYIDRKKSEISVDFEG